LLEENKSLKEETAKLEEQVKDNVAAAGVQEEWRKLTEEKVTFYKQMADEYRNLSDKQTE